MIGLDPFPHGLETGTDASADAQLAPFATAARGGLVLGSRWQENDPYSDAAKLLGQLADIADGGNAKRTRQAAANRDAALAMQHEAEAQLAIAQLATQQRAAPAASGGGWMTRRPIAAVPVPTWAYIGAAAVALFVVLR